MARNSIEYAAFLTYCMVYSSTSQRMSGHCLKTVEYHILSL